MHYRVYKNWTHERAIVHRADCGYCNDGRGIHTDASRRNGRWHGPFSDSSLASDRQAKLVARR